VLPNPSGLNRAFTVDAVMHAYSALRLAIDFRLREIEPVRSEPRISSTKGRLRE
jgi:hypothetical protein